MTDSYDKAIAKLNEIIQFLKEHTSPVQKPMTNADCIRAMSDEELANVLTDYSNNSGWITETGRQVCFERNLEWLKQPVKEDA